MRVNDAVSGAVIIVVAGAMTVMAANFPGFPGQNYGPGLFPTLIGIALLICGAVLVVRGVAAHLEQGESWFINEPESRSLLSFLLIVGSVLFYILASDTVGFILCSLVILLALFARFGVRWKVAVPVAIGTTLFIQYFFVDLMRVPLARGWLDAIL